MRKSSWIGHRLRKDCTMRYWKEGKLEGKRGMGRPMLECWMMSRAEGVTRR